MMDFELIFVVFAHRGKTCVIKKTKSPPHVLRGAFLVKHTCTILYRVHFYIRIDACFRFEVSMKLRNSSMNGAQLLLTAFKRDN